MDLFASSPPDPPAPAPAGRDGDTVLTVTQITRRIRVLLEGAIGAARVEGEVSNCRRQASGHTYFTLKDDTARLACVLFRHSARDRTAAVLTDGAMVRLTGDITVYEARGQYQMIVRRVEPAGQGVLQARFEALKRKLNDEGLFDPERKKPIPAMPRTVLLITSPDGAAVRDMLQVLGRRAPWVRVLIRPVRVQGAEAAGEIAAALAELSAPQPGFPAVDTVVVTRGGGSLEDLQAFNEESVARAIAACPLPVISAVGHEIDFTIADFVADLRAPTPSAAAELVAPDAAQLRADLLRIARRLDHGVRQVIDQHDRVLRLVAAGPLQRDPARLLLRWTQPLDEFADRLPEAAAAALDSRSTRLRDFHHRLDRRSPARLLSERRTAFAVVAERLRLGIAAALDRRTATLERRAALVRSLGPDSVLARGFSFTLGPDGRPLADPATLHPGDPLTTRLHKGTVHSTVTTTGD